MGIWSSFLHKLTSWGLWLLSNSGGYYHITPKSVNKRKAPGPGCTEHHCAEQLTGVFHIFPNFCPFQERCRNLDFPMWYQFQKIQLHKRVEGWLPCTSGRWRCWAWSKPCLLKPMQTFVFRHFLCFLQLGHLCISLISLSGYEWGGRRVTACVLCSLLFIMCTDSCRGTKEGRYLVQVCGVGFEAQWQFLWE